MNAARPGTHASAADLELYVIDALAAGPRRTVEQHVAACDRCARRLEAEAALEVALGELWPQVLRARRPLAAVVPLRSPRSSSVPPRRRSPLGGLAAAAIAVLFIGWWTDGGRLDRLPASSPRISCATTTAAGDDPADDTLLCISEAPPPATLASWAACAAPAPLCSPARAAR
jgi:anti-sigma factor RsiW